MEVKLTLQMHLRGDVREARSAATLWRFLDAIAAQGFYLGSLSQDQLYHWWEPTPEAASSTLPGAAAIPSGLSSRHVTAPDVSPALQAEVKAYAGGAEEGLAFTAYSIAQMGPLVGMELMCAVVPDERELDWLVDSRTFTKWPEPEANIVTVDAYLGLLVATYEAWHPIFGYAPGVSTPDTSREQAQAGKPQFLYAINLYGPEIVRALGGLESVLHAPAWRVCALDDGGALVVPIPYAVLGLSKAPYDEATVARYLGLPYVPYGERATSRLQYPSAF